MKKLLLSAVLVLAFAISANAQVERVFTKNNNLANVGVGYLFTSGLGLPPIAASYEYGIAAFGKRSSVGVGGAVSLYKFRGAGLYTPLGARGVYHVAILNNWEAFAGAMLGVEFYAWDGGATTDFYYNTFIGTRYMFTKNIGAFVEFSYSGYGGGAIGVSFKF